MGPELSGGMRKLWYMSTRSLFPDATENILLPDDSQIPRDPPRREKVARDFVKWCFSLGADFHNSPDIINLQFWLHMTKRCMKEPEQAELLDQARELHLKRVEQRIKTAAASVATELSLQ